MGDTSRKRKRGKAAPIKRKIVKITTDQTTGTTGPAIKHHNLYFEDGNFVIQVEDTMFKIHRSLLTRYSTVLSDMLEIPNEDGAKDGTDEKPLKLSGDSVPGWEVILGMQYTMPRVDGQPLNGEQMLLVLPIAHKYCMEDIETDIINLMKRDITSDGYVNLMVASRIVGSDELYQAGLNGLTASGEAPTVEQAKLIGAEATHIVMTKVIAARDASHAGALIARGASHTRELAARDATHAAALNARDARHTATLNAARTQITTALANTDNRKCRHCHQNTNWTCMHLRCRRNQV